MLKFLFHTLFGIALLYGVGYIFHDQLLSFYHSIPPKQLHRTFLVIGVVLLLFVIELTKKPAKKKD